MWHYPSISAQMHVKAITSAAAVRIVYGHHGSTVLLALHEETCGRDEAHRSYALPSREIKSSVHVLPGEVKSGALHYIRTARHNPPPCNLSRHARGGPGSESTDRTQCDAIGAQCSSQLSRRSRQSTRCYTSCIWRDSEQTR